MLVKITSPLRGGYFGESSCFVKIYGSPVIDLIHDRNESDTFFGQAVFDRRRFCFVDDALYDMVFFQQLQIRSQHLGTDFRNGFL